MRIRKASWVGALFALGVAGCGNSVSVDTSHPTMKVGGVVLEAGPGLQPIAGANVTVIAGGGTYGATTDMAGTFSIKDIPAGTVVVKIATADHFDAYVTAAQPSVGNFPVENASLTIGPIALVSSKGSVAFRLVDENGAPAANVRVTARALVGYLDLSNGGPIPRGAVEVAATSSSDGMVTLAGMPDYATIGPLVSDQFVLNIAPLKLMGQGGYEFLGLTLNLFATQYQPGMGQTPTIALAGPRSPLVVVSSIVDGLEGFQPGPIGSQVNAAGPITIAFNQAIRAETLRATLLTEFGATALSKLNATVNGNLVSIALDKPLDPGRYDIVIHADAAYNDQAKEYNNNAAFFVPQAQGAAVTVMARQDTKNANDVILLFSEPVGMGSGNTTQVPCAIFYETSLDGDPNSTAPGEWNSGGNNQLKCEANGQHPGLYIRPDEPQLGVNVTSPITGFASQWRVTARGPVACFNGYQCSLSNTTAHLVFSRNVDSGWLIKRSNGAPVPDLTFQMPSIM